MPLDELTRADLERFADDADFESWLARIMSENLAPAAMQPPTDARLLVCSTCAFDQDPYDTFAALSVIEKEQPAS